MEQGINNNNNNNNFTTAGVEVVHNPFSNIPRLSKSIAVVLFVIMLIGLLFGHTLEPILSLNVGYILSPHFYIWNVITAGFYESSLISGIMDILLLLLCGKFLEPIWGSKEFFRFIFVVNAFAGVSSLILMVILFAIIRNEYLLFNTNLSGFGGVIAGFTVAVKQLIPDQEFTLFFAVKVKAKHLPGMIVLIGIASFALGLPGKHLPHVIFGILGAWVYLRYYQRKGDITGDLSSSFAFATFWPEPVRPAITVIARILAYPLRLCGIIPSPSTTSSYSSPYSQNLALGPDAERRRAIAQRAVDARMAHLTTPQISSTSNNNTELISSSEIVPAPTTASLTSASSRPAAIHLVGDKISD